MFIKDFNLMIIWAQWSVAEATGRFTPILGMFIYTFTLTYTYGQEATDTGYQGTK